MTQDNSQAYSKLKKFIGIPYEFKGEKGMDCWQLAVAVRENVFGLSTPLYNYPGKSEYQDFLLDKSKEWRVISIPDVTPGDVLIISMGKLGVHCGVAIDSTKFIHTLEGRNSCIERINSISWRSRITGAYRWQI